MAEDQADTNFDNFDTANARIELLSPKQKKFLKAYGECGVVKYACKFAGIHRTTYYVWRDRDENFKACLPDAEADAGDTLEYAAYLQGVEGVSEPLVSMGQPVYEQTPMLDESGNPMLDGRGKPIMKRGKLLTVKKYSPQLLIKLLQARMPEKYKEKASVEHTGKDGGPVEIVTQWGTPKLQSTHEESE